MKFLVFSDIHSGLVRYSRTGSDGIPDRHTELMQGVEYIYQYAKDNQYPTVFITGDIFDINRPSQLFYADFITLFNKYSDIQTYIIPGNHDAINTIHGGNALRTLFKAKYPHVHIINEISMIEVEGYDCVFIPHINRCEYSTYTVKAEAELIATKIKDLKLSKKKNKLVFGHAMLPGSIQGAERLIMRGGEQTFTSEVQGTLAYFFGHMHTPQQMTWAGAPLYYPGSLQACDFSEREDQKSFMIVDVDEKDVVNTVRVGVPTRKMKQFDYKNITEVLAIQTSGPEASDIVQATDVDDCIVKVNITISSNEKKQVDEAILRQVFEKAYWVEFSYDIKVEAATRNEKVTADADPDIAFEEWYNSKSYPPEHYEEALQLHKETMAKVSVLKDK